MDEQPELPLDRLPVLRPGKGFTFLSNIRVIDLTSSIAGPYAAMLLSDFGAEVIKIESAAGDDSRGWGPPFHNGESLWFTAVNRNKKSVVLDLADEAGLERLRRLVETADVVITNQPAYVQKTRGLDYESLSMRKPDLIFVSITGFGLTGHRSGHTCYDLIAEGYSGIMDLTGDAASPPQKVGAPAADMLAGQDAAMATMAALFDRTRTGKGRLIDVALVDSMTRFLSCRLSSYMGSGEAPTRTGGTDSVIAIYQQFDTADRPMTLALGNDGIWKRFWGALGDAEFAGRPEFASNELRRSHRPEIVERIAIELRKRPRDEWLRILTAARVPAGPINTVLDVVDDQALQDRGLFFTLEEGERRVPQIGLGIRIDGQQSIPRSGPPRLGSHTEEVLGGIRQLETLAGTRSDAHTP